LPTLTAGASGRPQLVWLAAGIALLLVVVIGGGTASAQFENNDSSCAACHTQPETTYVARSQASPVDLASAHTAEQVACIDCHSGAGLTGRAVAITQGAQNLALYVSGHYQSPAILKNGIPDANCLKCHAQVTVDNSPANHFHYHLARWQASDPAAAGCTSCHQAHQTGGQTADQFLQQVVTDGVCQQCHANAKDAP
jgi:predicted CXXCH cytochrome family protein